MCKPWKKNLKRPYPVLIELRRVRESKKLPRKVISHKLGYHLMTVGRWERGETMPSLQVMHDWCQTLGVRLTIEQQ